MADGILGASDPSQFGIFGNMAPPVQSPFQSSFGLWGSALKDIGAQLGGRPEDANNLMQYQQVMRQNQLRQAIGVAANTDDQAVAKQAAAVMMMNGVDPSMIQKYRANQAMPQMFALMQPKTDYSLSPEAAKQIQAGQTNAAPTVTTTPGLSLSDALAKVNNPYLSQEVAPMLMNAQLAALAPYTLGPGDKRFVGSTQIASAPALAKIVNGVAYDPTNIAPGTVFNNPNQPFNADGTPNTNFQNFELRKAAAGPVARVEADLGMGIPLDPAAVQSHITNVLSGNETMAQVPQAYRQAVSNGMTGKPFAPIAQQRYTTAASKITAPYTAMSSYKLASDGLPYLQRIAAAAQTPGSVSDQDLLDSLTKLNTGGNAVTDAQVKLITEGKSFADWASVLGNRLKNGGELSDNQRQQIQTIAGNIYANYRKGYEPVYQEVSGKLSTAGIPKQFWTIPDLDSIAAKQGAATGNLQAPSKANATQTRTIGGKTYHQINRKWYQE